MADGLFERLVVTNAAGTLTFDEQGLRVTTVSSPGELHFIGNELTIRGFGDPAKLRLVDGAVSFNWMDATGTQQELVLLHGGRTEDDPASLGGQLQIYCRRKNATGDSAMRRVGVISPAYTATGLPTIRLIDTTQLSLGPFAEGPIGPPVGAVIRPTALVLQTNLVGVLDCVQVEGDTQWLLAGNTYLDVRCEVDLSLTGIQTQIRVELRRTQNGGTSPYVYLLANGNAVASGYRPSGTAAEVMTAPITGLTGSVRVAVVVSAQDGTVEIGAVTAQ